MDAETFQAEAMQHQRLLYRVSYSILSDNDDCADAVQEALLRAWQHRGSLHSMEAFRPWLVRILVNVCHTILRKRVKQRFVPLEDTSAPVAETGGMPAALDDALGLLSSEQRVVTVLHYLEGYSVREIAEMTATPVGTVKTRMMYARQRLQGLLREEMEGE
ncbi:MAG: RNA polymerase sigma factor [Clostridia bacterium]